MSAGFHQLRSDRKKPILRVHKSVKALGRQSPTPFGITTPCSASGARSIDQHDISLSTPMRKLLEFTRRIEQAGFDPRAGTLRSGTQFRKASTVRIGREDRRPRRGRGQCERLPPCPGTQVNHPAIRRRLACKRNQLTSLVLHLDESGFKWRLIIDSRVGLQTNAPWTELRRLRPLEGGEHVPASGSRDVHPEVKRCSCK